MPLLKKIWFDEGIKGMTDDDIVISLENGMKYETDNLEMLEKKREQAKSWENTYLFVGKKGSYMICCK